MTVREATQWAAGELRGNNLLRDRAELDSRHLLEIATGHTRAHLLAYPDRPLEAEAEVRLRALVTRRLRSEPIQHLRGTQEFYGRDFLVTPDVLIPRPETEDIVTAVLEAAPDRTAPLRIADVGTGSGALAITLALELPQSRVIALDLSPAALAVAQANTHRLGTADRIVLLESDLLAAVPGERFDIVVSNPPYIPRSDTSTLHPEVRDFEPHLALFADDDGLAIYRRLIPQAHAHLCPGGLLLLETGGRVDLLLHWLRGWQHVQVRPDLQGIPRVLSARRSPG